MSRGSNFVPDNHQGKGTMTKDYHLLRSSDWVPAANRKTFLR